MYTPHSAFTSLTLAGLRLLALLILGTSFGQTTAPVHAQTRNGIVAIVNGRKITQQEIDDSLISQILPLEQQIYTLRRAALENLILRTIIEDEAKKRGVSVEELRKQLTAGKVDVPPSQVEEVYSDNASVFAAMSPDEAKERIRLDLESQARMRIYRAALSGLKEASKIEVRLEEPKLPPINASGTAPAIGPKEAAITIAEFSDFQCPYCKGSQSTIKQVLQNYRNEVRLVFKHLPLEIHPQAFSSARAAFCAGEQAFFWQYHDALFASDNLSPETFNKIAAELGLDLPKLKACFDSENSRSAILKDLREANRLGINSTPTFIINGKLFRGALSFEEFKATIQRELESAQSGSRTQ